ncbi:MAG: glycosyltransferase, partial [bacterium]
MILTVLTMLLIGLGLPYLWGIAALILGLGRVRGGKNDDTPLVSVVVAARNEEEHIGDCLAALAAQNYPQQSYEIIVVDDRSNDRTPEVVSRWVEEADNVHLLRVGSEESPLVGKKRALDLGIRQSRGEIILTTDADCRPKPTWIRGMVSHFEPGVGLVAGYSYTEDRGEGASLLQKFRSLERIGVAAVAAGSIGLGKGITCSGQNLAYRKEAYFDLGGFSKIGHLRSGDDDLLIQHLDRYTSWGKRYAISPETHVRTRAPVAVAQFIQQEKRRASKG